MNNILIINYHPLTQIGGVQSVIKTLIKKKKNFSVLTGDTENKHHKKNNFYSTPSLYLKKPSKELDFFLNKIFQEQTPKIIYTHNLSYMFSAKVAKHIFNYFKKKGCIMVEHTHHALIRRQKRVKKILSLNWDGLIVVSKYAAKRLFPITNKKTKKIIIYNGINLNYFGKSYFNIRKKLKLENKKVLLFPSRTIRLSTGKIGEQKQFKTVLKALKNIKNKEKIVLLIPYLENKNNVKIKEFYNILKKMNLEKNVIEFPKKINQNEMYKFYSTGDFVLFPSLNESFGLIILEAWASKKPIIGAYSGAIPELIKNNKTGILFKSKNSIELKKKIEELITNTKKSNFLLAQGKLESNNFSDKKMIQKILNFINCLNEEKVIYLVRHGETTYNAKNLFTGQANPPLTKKGEKQAKKISFFLKKINNPKIYCSTLKRAKKTAKIIGLKKISYKKKLIEIDVGLFESKTKKEILKNNHFNFKKMTSYPKGESFKNLEKRLNSFLKNTPKKGNIIIIAHGTVNRMISSIITKTNYAKTIHQKNDEIIIISNKNTNYLKF